jgi:hypothetical protein
MQKSAAAFDTTANAEAMLWASLCAHGPTFRAWLPRVSSQKIFVIRPPEQNLIHNMAMSVR